MRLEIIETTDMSGKNPLFRHVVETNLTAEALGLLLQQGSPEEDCARLLFALMKHGYRCALGGLNAIYVYDDKVYIAEVSVNGTKAVINSKDSDRPGAIEPLSEFLARCGFNDVGISSGGKK